MKSKAFNILLLAGILMMNACKKDNYTAPEAGIEGAILDQTGAGLQTEQGASNTRIKLEELSWSSAPVPQYLNVRIDGSYINTKLFAGKYRATPIEGPFYPVTGDEIDISGSSKHDFKVVPYLNIQWVGEPVIAADKKVSVSFKFSRNANPTAGGTMPNLRDYQFFISTTKYVGNNNAILNMVAAAVAVTNDKEGQNITISTITPLKYATTYFLRVGVRTNDSFSKYNYTTIKTIDIP